MKGKKKTVSKRDELAIGITAAVLIVAAIAALLIFVVFREDEMDRAERILKENDYNILAFKREGDDSPLTLEPTLRARLRANHKESANVINILEFKEEADARDFYDKMKGEYTLMQTMRRHGRYVYYGSVATYDLLK